MDIGTTAILIIAISTMATLFYSAKKLSES